MDARELRIGNYVNRLGQQTVVNSVSHGLEGLSYVSTKASGVVTENQIESIPLTEEWLLKFGFEKRERKYYLSTLSMKELTTYPITILWLSGEIYLSIGDSTITYGEIPVHRLQNLYYALTGEELTIIETV